MKIDIGSPVDHDQCTVLTHEYLQCDDSFQAFHAFASMMINHGQNRWLSYKAYNAYSSFIHHLYEFMLGCLARDNGNTRITNKSHKVRTQMCEAYITHHVQRILNSKRSAILNGTAPKWENNLKYYPEQVPVNFAKDFRDYRNKVSGHVAYERASKLSLSNFYLKYHKYLYLLYQDSKRWWGKQKEDFPNLKEITDFSVVIFKKTPN